MKASKQFVDHLTEGVKALKARHGWERVANSAVWSVFWAISDKTDREVKDWSTSPFHAERAALKDAHIETAMKAALKAAGMA